MEEKETMTIIDENGQEKEVEIINYFTLKSNGKDYVTFTENKEDAKGNVIVYTSEVVEKGDSIELVGITDKNILNEVKDVLIDLSKDGE